MLTSSCSSSHQTHLIPLVYKRPSISHLQPILQCLVSIGNCHFISNLSIQASSLLHHCSSQNEAHLSHCAPPSARFRQSPASHCAVKALPTRLKILWQISLGKWQAQRCLPKTKLSASNHYLRRVFVFNIIYKSQINLLYRLYGI